MEDMLISFHNNGHAGGVGKKSYSLVLENLESCELVIYILFDLTQYLIFFKIIFLKKYVI